MGGKHHPFQGACEPQAENGRGRGEAHPGGGYRPRRLGQVRSWQPSCAA